MAGELQPLTNQQRIVNMDGTPNDYFIRWAQDRQVDIQGAVTAEQALAIVVQFMLDHPLIPGSGITLTPSGDINDHVTIAADVQAILDQVSVVRGTVLYRGALGWAGLPPGTAGDFLKTNGAGADPAWATASGGGGHPWYWNPPLAASMTLVSGDATNVTLTDSGNVGLRVAGGVSVAGNIIRGAFQALAGAGVAAFSRKVRIEPAGSGLNGQNGFGLVLRESATNKIANVGCLFGNRFDGYYGTMSSYNSQIGFPSNYGATPPFTFLRADFDGANTYSFYESADGEEWALMGTVNRATAFTTRADQIGIGFANTSAGRRLVMACPYFV